MQSDANKKLINDLKQHINNLQQQIHYLNGFINHTSVYEYYIQGVKIDKVTGTLQLGHLIEKEVKDQDGLHRFFVGEIKIREIEGTGTVGLGVTEKGIQKSNKKNHLSQEEAPEEVSKIYEDIKTSLSIENVPMFFQVLGVQESVLKIVWENIKDHEDEEPSDGYYHYYEIVLKLLNDLNVPQNTSDRKLGEDTYITLATNIEEYTKTLIVISHLFSKFLPDYLERYGLGKKISPEKLNTNQQNKVATLLELTDAIKDTFQLKELPTSFEQISEQSNSFRFFFYNILAPVVNMDEVNNFFIHLHDLTIKTTLEKLELNNLQDLSTEEQIFLFSTLIDFFDRYQKYIILDYLLLQV